jgi:cytochrome c553
VKQLALMSMVVALATSSACARRSPPQVTAVDAERGNVEIAELQQGRKLLLGKCAGCHKTPMPTDHTAAQWPKLIDEMADKAKLDATQRGLITKYLIVMSER